MISNIENECDSTVDHDVQTFFTALQYKHKAHKLKLDAKMLALPFKDLPQRHIGEYNHKHLVAWTPKANQRGITLYDTSYSTPKFYCFIGVISNRAAGPLFYYYNPKNLNSRATRELPYHLQYGKASTNLSKIVGDIVKGCEGTSVETLLYDIRNRTHFVLQEWVDACLGNYSINSAWLYNTNVAVDLQAIRAAGIIPQSKYLQEMLGATDDITEYHRRSEMLPPTYVFKDDSRCAYMYGDTKINQRHHHNQHNQHSYQIEVVIKDSLDDMPDSIQSKLAMLTIAPTNVVIDNVGVRISDTQFAILGIHKDDLT